ncbi:hypothetical protein ACPCHT_10280 [Nucisporomicrobium flavum]|uniref:hypothetical protein n=1 Tax=Nucisporomicrobium flavum TaxID=2785915 RepID=UPI001F208203|nr:hypothetical protein [Nucisporomicrobium flavum]
MRTRQAGRRRHLFPLLCAGLAVALPAGPAPLRPAAPAPPSAHGPDHPVAAAATAPSAADLAVRFQALLGQHSVLAADLMRSRIRGDDAFAQAANAALGGNTDAMTSLVGQLFGAATADKFRPMWSDHIVALVAYAGAVAERDTRAKGRARAELVEDEQQLGRFFAGASHGRLPPKVARAAVVMHVNHLTGQADAYAAADYTTADRLYREGYQHTYGLGLTLADALLPAADRATLRAPVWRLRSQLGEVLAEHAVLLEDVNRAAVANTADFDAAGDTINANTRDLAAAIDTLFGASTARRFQSLWASHVELLVEYAAATAAGKPDRRHRAQAELRTFEHDMAAVLAPATGGRVPAADLSAALQEHDRMLLEHADAYAARDYRGAQDLAGRTYEHMFALARGLADGFGATVAARLPHGGAQTGYGGLAGVTEHR